MSYGGALPAGSYGGSFGAYRPRREAPSNQGASLRNGAMQRAVSLGGLAALGGGNLCTDSEWIAAQSVLDLGFGLFEGATAPTTPETTTARTTTSTGTWGTVAEAGSGLMNVWGTVCDAERERNAQDAAAANTQLLMESAAADRAALDRATAESRRASDLYAQFAAVQRQPTAPAPAPAGIDTNTLLIVGGIAAAALVGVLLLR